MSLEDELLGCLYMRMTIYIIVSIQYGFKITISLLMDKISVSLQHVLMLF